MSHFKRTGSLPSLKTIGRGTLGPTIISAPNPSVAAPISVAISNPSPSLANPSHLILSWYWGQYFLSNSLLPPYPPVAIIIFFVFMVNSSPSLSADNPVIFPSCPISIFLAREWYKTSTPNFLHSSAKTFINTVPPPSVVWRQGRLFGKNVPQ